MGTGWLRVATYAAYEFPAGEAPEHDGLLAADLAYSLGTPIRVFGFGSFCFIRLLLALGVKGGRLKKKYLREQKEPPVTLREMLETSL